MRARSSAIRCSALPGSERRLPRAAPKDGTIEGTDTKPFSSAHQLTTTGAQGQHLDTTHAIGLSLAAGPSVWMAMEGGFEILFEDECVGGIGISGGDWEQDQAIAQAA